MLNKIKEEFEKAFGDNDFDFEEYADLESVWNWIDQALSTAKAEAIKEYETNKSRKK